MYPSAIWGQCDSQYGAMEISDMVLKFIFFVTLGELLNFPITEEVGSELAQLLLMLTFHDSLGRIHFHGRFKSGYIFRLNSFARLLFLPLNPYGCLKADGHGVKPNYLELSKTAVLILFFILRGRKN